jgi:hypothetical protein
MTRIGRIIADLLLNPTLYVISPLYPCKSVSSVSSVFLYFIGPSAGFFIYYDFEMYQIDNQLAIFMVPACSFAG